MTSIRLAAHADLKALEYLAQLDSSQIPAAPVLLAEEDGALVAALSLRDGAVIADPFVRSADTVKLLHVRASQVDPPRSRRLVARRRMLRPA